MQKKKRRCQLSALIDEMAPSPGKGEGISMVFANIYKVMRNGVGKLPLKPQVHNGKDLKLG